MDTERKDVYARVTDQIVAAIEAGAGSWRMPWHHTGREIFHPRNAVSERTYRGINVISLWAAAEAQGYSSGIWATYKQWQGLGAKVRKGQTATLIVFWKITEAERENAPEDDEGSGDRRFFAIGHSVFNADQVDGYTPPEVPTQTEPERISRADHFFSNVPAVVLHGGGQAFFCPATDHVQMPEFGNFTDSLSYYSVLAHELTHWTGAASRLNRDLSHRFGTDAYAVEELVAELGAAFLCADLGLENEPRPDHAAYVASWLKVLNHNKRAIFTAASKAQAAADWMHERQQILAA